MAKIIWPCCGLPFAGPSFAQQMFLLGVLLSFSQSSWAEPAHYDPVDDYLRPDGIHILDGSCVLDVGELQVNITNHGLIGSQYSSALPYSHAPSAQWPTGSGDEYLWGAGLWIGGRISGEVSVSTGQYERELRPGDRLRDTIYEAVNGFVMRPMPVAHATGRRMPTPGNDDDQDGSFDEDHLNGRDDDGDGQVDEDFAQLGDQMFTCTMYDNLPLISEIYTDHRPMGLRVVQRAFTWYQEDLENIVGLDFEISNVGHHTIEQMYLGFFVDGDIQRRAETTNEPNDMAGFFDGAVRDENGIFYRANIAYMFDGAEENPLPGCLGVMLIDHTTEFLGRDAPFLPQVNSFQIFATNSSVNQEGEPNDDADRYYLMSRNQHDRNTWPDEAADIKYLISSGPFNRIEPGKTLNYKLAMIIGDGLEGMLRTAVKAAKVGVGRYYDMDNAWWTGTNGKETRVCYGDFPSYDLGDDPLVGRRFWFMNEECAGDYPIMGYFILPEPDDDVPPDQLGNICFYVNMDNCEECFRARGYDCTPDVFHSTNMWHTKTGMYGRETNFPWSMYQETPPPSPEFRVAPGDHQVEIFWNDRSEHTLDPDRGVNDFESYRVWKVHHWARQPGMAPTGNPPANMWGMIAEFDLFNFIEAGVGGSPNQRNLGRNTGLEDAVYIPACLGDPRFEGLAEEMQAVVDSDTAGRWLTRPPVRNSDGSVAEGMEGLGPWNAYPAVLDTFFYVAARPESEGVVGKRSTKFYHYLDADAQNGFQAYYSVTASDHLLANIDGIYYPAGYGTQEDPGNDFVATIPRPDSQTVEQRRLEGQNIYVYPNPATRESLAEYLAQPPSHDDPTGVRVTWANLPRANNTIHIFTESGDLIQTLDHNGFDQGGSISWNLVSRNGQEIVSGIYLYVVKSDIGGFADFQGRFVVIN